MSDERVKSITLYGEVKSDKDEWLNWYKKAKDIIKLLGYEANYFSIEGGSLKSGKVMRLNRNEKKLFKAINCGDEIKWIAVYSLPLDYGSASFDYDVFLVRNFEYVTLTANISDFKKINEDEMLKLLKEHININNGEIYEMEREDCPFIYASKANSLSSFTTLKIIKTI